MFSLQDVATSLVLAEGVYKCLDGPLDQAMCDISEAAAELPTQLRQPLELQWSPPDTSHRSQSQA